MLRRYFFGDTQPKPTVQPQPVLTSEPVITPTVIVPPVETKQPGEENQPPLPRKIDVKTSSKVTAAYECEYVSRFFATLSQDGRYYQTAKDEYIEVKGVNNGWKICPTAYLRNASVSSDMVYSDKTVVDVQAELNAYLGNINGNIQLENVSKEKGFGKKIHSEATLFGVASVKSETILTPVVETPSQGPSNTKNNQF